jgi:hypothetical protein
MVFKNTLYPSRDSLLFLVESLKQYFGSEVHQVLENRVYSLRLRILIEGYHSRRIWDAFWFNFFPLSVGFGPTDSCARGAFTDEESALCHSQEIPSSSSSSAIHFFQSFPKNQASIHSKKYLWIALALPYCSFGIAFHWIPVRSTNTIPENTVRASIDFLHHPDLRIYFWPGSRFFSGIRGATFSQRASDTSHDWSFAIYKKKKSKILTYSTLLFR